jgi:6-phosphogluconolactonase
MEGAGMESNHYKLNEFDEKESLVDKLAEDIITCLKEALKSKIFATLAVSGGSTPKQLFQKLSKIEFPWERVKVTLVDERWVDPNNENSNERLVKDFLLQDKAKKAKFCPLKTKKKFAKDGVKELVERYKGFTSSIDVVILGMGSDGHTASFFPNMQELNDALNSNKLVCATTATAEPKERITLTRSYLLKASHLLLHIEGETKKEVFDKACVSDDVEKMPIISMMQQKSPLLEVHYAK